MTFSLVWDITLDMKVYTRIEAAQAAGIHPAVVKNWSTGKPITITPSIRNEGKRGSLTLYSEEDVALIKRVAHLEKMGFRLDVAYRHATAYKESFDLHVEYP